MCAKFVDKYIINIFSRQANSFEHFDVLCGLGTTLYNLLLCGAVRLLCGATRTPNFKKKFSLRGNHGEPLPSPSVHGNSVGNFSGVGVCTCG